MGRASHGRGAALVAAALLAVALGVSAGCSGEDPSFLPDGEPGRPGVAEVVSALQSCDPPDSVPAVVITEVFASGAAPGQGWVELHRPLGTDAVLDPDWTLLGAAFSWAVTVPAYGYVVVCGPDATVQCAARLPISAGGEGTVALAHGGELVDQVAWKAATGAGKSWQLRHPWMENGVPGASWALAAWTPGEKNAAVWEPVEAADCLDADPCTADTCEDGACAHSKRADCCKLASECDDADPCTVDSCKSNRCEHIAKSQGCCYSDADCAPATPDQCYMDVCVGGTCKRFFQATECCPDDAWCKEKEDDGNPCTAERCVVVNGATGERACRHVVLSECVVPIPYSQGFDGGGPLATIGWRIVDFGTPALANWALTTEGELGPDTFLRFGWSPTTPKVQSVASSPTIDCHEAEGDWTNVFKTATVQWTMSYRHATGGGPVTLRALVTDDGWLTWTTVREWAGLASDVEYGIQSYPLPGAMWKSDSLRFGMMVDTGDGTTFDMDGLNIDDVRVAAGVPNRFVSARILRCKDGAADCKHVGNYSAVCDTRPGQKAPQCEAPRPGELLPVIHMGVCEWYKVMACFDDPDATYSTWNFHGFPAGWMQGRPLDPIPFVAPEPCSTDVGDFCEKGSTRFLCPFEFRPDCDESMAGTWRSGILTRDEWDENKPPHSVFESLTRFTLDVSLESGYVVWSPLGPAEPAAVALKAAVAATGRKVMVAKDLLALKDLGRYSAILAVLGARGHERVVTPDEAAALAGYLDGGGRVYLEGGDFFAPDRQPATVLHPYFETWAKSDGPGGTVKTAGPATGAGFLHGLALDLDQGALNNVNDVLAHRPASGAREVLRVGGSIPGALMVAHEAAVEGGKVRRTVASSFSWSALVATADSTPAEAFGRLLSFLDGGYPGCAGKAECDDFDPCTADSCDAGACANSRDPDCTECLDDLYMADGVTPSCADDQACAVAAGFCTPIVCNGVACPVVAPSNAASKVFTPDSPADMTLAPAGFGEASDLQVKVRVTTPYRGDVRLTLRSPDGTEVVLKERDPYDFGRDVNATFDLGVPLPPGQSMSTLDGTWLSGDWVLRARTSLPYSNGRIESWTLFASGGVISPDCGSCHGLPPAGAGSLVKSPAPTGSATAGAHMTHKKLGYGCLRCHQGSFGAGPTHNNGSINLGFSLFGDTLKGGAYDGQAGVGYASDQPGTSVSSGGTKTCRSIYCHGENPDGTAWGGGTDTAPRWDGTIGCKSCHDGAGSASNLPGSHRRHVDTATYAYACAKCHADTVDEAGDVKDDSLHPNHVADVSMPGGGGFDPDGKGCTGTPCHTDGRGGPPNTPPTWGSAPAQRCSACHGGRAGEPPEIATGGHDRLSGSGWIRRYPCQYCHARTADAVNGIADYTKHVDGQVEVAIPSKWGIVGRPAPTFDKVKKVCANVYCHSDGTTVDPEVREFAWDGGRTKCNTCHGHPTGDCKNCHTGMTGWPAGQEWKEAMPMYPNGGPGTERANSHARHLELAFTCQNCHARTVANGNCTDCHKDGVPPGSMSEVNHISPAYHVNRVKDVSFVDGGTYDPVTKRCSNTACHTGGSPQWGGSVADEVLCLTCHGTTSPDVDDFTPFNGVRGLINMPDWKVTGHGRPANAGNYPSGNPPAGFPGNPCWYCHDRNALHNDANNPFRLKKHDQFSKRFDRECAYCHMEGKDDECRGCHDSAESLAPQLPAIAGPPDHAPYVLDGSPCTGCHATDAVVHNTGAGKWTADQNADVRNQYVMMGVCLKCHDDDRNGACNGCHTGDKYKLGYDPGTGYISARSKASSTHFGYKHWAQHEATGVWKGGKFCWDCHDSHGDKNIYMIQDKVATVTDGTFGKPIARAAVSFTRRQSGLDYVRTSAPYNGLCNVCHTEPKQHYRFDYGDGHNAGRICTTCHEHRFSDSHGSNKPCTSCHAGKPIPRHGAFGQTRDCTKCHTGVVGERMDVMGQFRSNSHHVQGTQVTNKHCYACHWEATPEGLIDVTRHEGYDYKKHTTVKGAPVDLVLWGPGSRPQAYVEGNTAVTFTARKVGTAEERGEVSKVTAHCLSCHSDQNHATEPFDLVDPDGGDCKTPGQYAWDGSSIAARYSQTGTATWGKYTGTANAAQKTQVKAFSAHGNAAANHGGWSPTTGEDGALPDTRNGTEPVQCFDCHSSHGSKTQGVTSSYTTFNGTFNGGNLKETQAGKGGYPMTYRAAAGGSATNPYAAGAAQCFDCHETATAGTMPWGYQSTFGATAPILGYRDAPRFGKGPRGITSRTPFMASREALGGHLKAASAMKTAPAGTIAGLCTPCHDPHGVSPSLGANQKYGLPLLKGTWLTSPYKEDQPPAAVTTQLNPPTPDVHLDQNTFTGGGTIAETEDQFAGLCLRCHPKAGLTDGTNKNQPWRSLDRIHESVKGWGANTQHNYPCSKCHNAHQSGLPKLLRTNALDTSHRGRVVSGGAAGSGSRGSFPRGKDQRSVQCHPTPEGWPNNLWNNVSRW